MTKIAIIEDDQTLAQMYQMKLEKAGYECKIAIDGQQGLDLIKSFKPDLVLLDLMLPQVSGDKVLETMRANDWGRNVRVIVMTNVSENEAPDKLKKLDVLRYIVKALYTPSQVLEIINQVLAPKKSD
ncbi:MAG TPA: response regulator [Patescibacteria group bacterium]|nr:response regulator [Patescibacteria group bacterium]